LKKVLIVAVITLAGAVLAAYAFVWRPLEVGGEQLRNYASLQFYDAVLRDYQLEHQRYPVTLHEALVSWASRQRELRPYERGVDFWGHRVYYVTDGSHFTLASFGHDNAPDRSLPWPPGGTPRGDKAPCKDVDTDTVVFDSGVEQACCK
jgi:hypothetical protein